MEVLQKKDELAKLVFTNTECPVCFESFIPPIHQCQRVEALEFKCTYAICTEAFKTRDLREEHTLVCEFR